MHSSNILTHCEIIRNNLNKSDREITKDKCDSTRAHRRHLAGDGDHGNKRKIYCTHVHMGIIEILITLMYKLSAITLMPLHVPDTELTQKIEDMHSTCKECVTSKRYQPSDRGLLGVLPLPHMVNALLYVDFIDRPKCHNYDYALMIVDALSAFCHVVPCKKTIDAEGVLKLIKHHWIRFHGPPVRIHSDKDIRFKGDYGPYCNVFGAMGVEVPFSQLYRPQSNGLCERMNDEYQEELRILRQSIEISNWVQLNDYVVICMNHQQRGKYGYSRGNLFHGRPTLLLDLPFPHEGNVQVQDRVKEQNKIAQVVQDHLRKGRASRFERSNRRKKPAIFNVGDYVLVSRNWFKQLEVPKGARKDVIRYGRYLVIGVNSSDITVRCSPTLGGEVPVAFDFVKRFHLSWWMTMVKTRSKKETQTC